MSTTARFALPQLHAGQAQKELSHNEALTLIDALCHPCVEAIGLDVPPGDPMPGACWIVGDVPEAAWTGRAAALAIWTANGWRFSTPVEGLCVWVTTDGVPARYRDGGWEIGTVDATRLRIAAEQVVGPRQPAIPDPDGGMVVDVEARATIEAVLTALRTHGLIDTAEL